MIHPDEVHSLNSHFPAVDFIRDGESFFPVSLPITMQLCHVTGTVVSSRKHEALRKGKLLVVRPVDREGNLLSKRDLLALDPGFDAGIGDNVLVAKEGQVVAQLLDSEDSKDAPTPANVVIIAVVDDWSK